MVDWKWGLVCFVVYAGWDYCFVKWDTKLRGPTVKAIMLCLEVIQFIELGVFCSRWKLSLIAILQWCIDRMAVFLTILYKWYYTLILHILTRSKLCDIKYLYCRYFEQARALIKTLHFYIVIYCFTYILMPHNMIILYFRLSHFHVSNRAWFST